MSFVLKEQNGGHIIEMTVSGALTKEAYQELVPLLDVAVQKYGKIRLMLVMMGFHGWDAGAGWQDIQIESNHLDDIERLVLVGEAPWEKGMSIFCDPFKSATIRYLCTDKMDAARRWIQEGLHSELE